MNRSICALSCTLLATFLPVSAQAQLPGTSTGGVIVAGSDYKLTGPAQPAAPGQVMLISVYGIKTSIAKPEVAVPTASGWPTSLQGISVDLVQGNPSTSTAIPLRAVWQGTCPITEACTTITGITLQLPFTLQMSPLSYLRIKENGTPAGAVLIRPVPDRIHVINTCDNTQITVGASTSAPPDICTPAVLVNGRLNSLYNLIKPGDHVALWAYGLGVTSGQPPEPGSPVDPTKLFPPIPYVRINYDYRPNAPASPVVPGYGLTGEPEFFGHIGAGSYQINFSIPSPPGAIPACDGVRITSNLTVTISGPNSFDAAQLCVQPQ